MDLKALIARIDHLEKKQVLIESEDRIPAKKKETSWTDKSGKKHPATQVQGHQSRKADKEAEKDSKKDEGIVFRSHIAQELLREFGLEEADEFKFSPEQEKWLGGADRQDPYIINRMPGPKPPVSFFKDPAMQQLAKQMKFPATAAPTRSTAPAAAAPAAAAPAAGAAAGAAGQAASPAAGATKTQDMGDGSKLTTGPGGVAATNDDGTPYIPGSNPNLPKNQTKTQDMGDGSKLTTGPGGVAATNDDGTPYIPGSNPNLPQNKPAGGQAASPTKPAAPTGTTAQGDDDGNTMITKPDGTTMVVGPDGNAIKPGSNPNLPGNKPPASGPSSVNAQGQNVTMPDGTNPETGEKPAAQAAAPGGPLQLPPGAAPEPGMSVAGGDKPAGGQAASPAKPAAGGVPPWVSRLSPSNFAQATQLGLLKNGKPDDAAIKKFQTDNGLKSDGIIGPQTIIAVTSAANLDKSGGAGRGGQGGPTAAQMAQANASKPGQANASKPGQAASPAAGAAPDPVKDPAGYKKYMNDRIMKAQQNKQGGQAASPAALPGKAVPGGGQISSTPAAESIYDDIVLQRIRELSGM